MTRETVGWETSRILGQELLGQVVAQGQQHEPDTLVEAQGP